MSNTPFEVFLQKYKFLMNLFPVSQYLQQNIEHLI